MFAEVATVRPDYREGLTLRKGMVSPSKQGRRLDWPWAPCYIQSDLFGSRHVSSKELLTMVEQEEVQEERKKGKGKLMVLLAAVGGFLAIFAVRRRRRPSEEEEE